MAQGLFTPNPSLSPTHLSIRRGRTTTTHYTHHQVSLVVPSLGLCIGPACEAGLSAGSAKGVCVSPNKKEKKNKKLERKKHHCSVDMPCFVSNTRWLLQQFPNDFFYHIWLWRVNPCPLEIYHEIYENFTFWVIYPQKPPYWRGSNGAYSDQPTAQGRTAERYRSLHVVVRGPGSFQVCQLLWTCHALIIIVKVTAQYLACRLSLDSVVIVTL